MDPELPRLKGELLIALDPGAKADAEVAFCQAIDIAQRQSSKSWELRAAMSMARLWRDQGKRNEARDSCSGLQLVHRRLRHARSERGKGVARGVGGIGNRPITFWRT